MRNGLLVGIFWVLLLAALASAAETVRFRSSDGVNLVGTWSVSAGTGPATLVLFPMLGKDRSTWDSFTVAAVKAGYSVLAVDLRGHGESIGSDNGQLSFKSLAESDFRAMIRDAAAAVAFVHSKSASRVILVGASIGANVAISYAATDPTVSAVVLLSPGEVFRGVMTKPAMVSYLGRPALLVAAEDDNYSAVSARTLRNLNGASELVVYPTGGHGTFLFESRPELTSRILDFVGTIQR